MAHRLPIEKGEGNRRALLVELADKLAAHAAVEEKVFYPAVMAKQTTKLLHESVEEHLAIKRVLADLIEKSLDDETFMAKISVLKKRSRITRTRKRRRSSSRS